MSTKSKPTPSTRLIKQVSRTNIILSIILGVLAVAVVTLTILLISANHTTNMYAGILESSYQKAYFNLVDDVNNAEVRMSKVLSSSDENYIGDLLQQINKNANDAQNNLNALPVSINGIEESITFINQLGGYCETLSKSIAQGHVLTAAEKQTLSQLYDCLLTMKLAFEEMGQNRSDDYSILNLSLSMNSDYNDFTVQMQSLKTNDVEYPTMIYDGPFSDSQVKKEVKGLNKSNVLEAEQVKHKLANLFNISAADIEYHGDTINNFETYDFIFEGNAGNEIFVQMSKWEGKLITMASYKDETTQNITVDKAQNLAEQFIKSTGINNVRCVWRDVVGGNAYFNFAPVVNDIVLYPDLVKVKCDLADGEILGYEARSYYTNHTNRSMAEFAITKEQAQTKILDSYVILHSGKALAPINFAEVLCYEFECGHDGDTYYIYVNGITGSVDNILKVIETADGNKIM